MIAVYQVINGGMSLNEEELLKRARYHATRGHNWKLDKPRVESALRKQSFSVRVVNEWNSLPAHVVGARTITQFKEKLLFLAPSQTAKYGRFDEISLVRDDPGWCGAVRI